MRSACGKGQIAQSGLRMMVKVERLDNSSQMRSGTKEHHDVENLVARAHNVKPAWPDPLGHFGRIEHDAGHVEDTFETEIAPAHLTVGLVDAKVSRGVEHGHDACEPEQDEESGAEGLPSRLVARREDDDGCAGDRDRGDLMSSHYLALLLFWTVLFFFFFPSILLCRLQNCTHHAPVKPRVLCVAVEAVVDARDPASQNQAQDAQQVQEEVPVVHLVRVVGKQVEPDREAQTDYHAGKVAAESDTVARRESAVLGSQRVPKVRATHRVQHCAQEM